MPKLMSSISLILNWLKSYIAVKTCNVKHAKKRRSYFKSVFSISEKIERLSDNPLIYGIGQVCHFLGGNYYGTKT